LNSSNNTPANQNKKTDFSTASFVVCGTEIDRPCPYGFPCSTNADCLSKYCDDSFCDTPPPVNDTQDALAIVASDNVQLTDVFASGEDQAAVGAGQLKTVSKATVAKFMGWTPLGDTDTGNTPCGQDIGYQVLFSC
jgi:hypothetical protein